MQESEDNVKILIVNDQHKLEVREVQKTPKGLVSFIDNIYAGCPATIIGACVEKNVVIVIAVHLNKPDPTGFKIPVDFVLDELHGDRLPAQAALLNVPYDANSDTADVADMSLEMV